MNHYKSITVNGRKMSVYLPPSYKADSQRHYPVAYVQDGGELIDHCTNQLEHLYLQGELEEAILVGIEPYNRNDEYTPWPAEPLLSSYPAFGGRGRSYVDEVADVLKPFIDENYRTKPEAQHTAIIGGSFGGLISLFAGCWRPDTFGRLGLLSASFWYEGVLDFIRERAVLAGHLRIFMSVGDCEGIYKQTVQKSMVGNTLQAHSLLLEKGVAADQLYFVVEEGGTHDAVFMAKHFPGALKWLLGAGPSLTGAEAGFTIPGTRQWTMRARNTGREYRLFLYVPAAPPPEKGYPVLYALDGNASFGSLTEAMRLQSRPPHGFQPGVIVSIGYDSDEPIVTDRRFYDYTEPADQAALPERPDGSPWPETGGADAFLDFIENELKPAVEARCPIDRERQSLFGHSLGGLFALHALAAKPYSFRHFIAGSPSIWWNNRRLLERAALIESRLNRGDVGGPALLIGVGSEEKPFMVEDAERLHRILLPCQANGLRLAYRVFQGEGHVSVIPPLISCMLRFISEQREGL